MRRLPSDTSDYARWLADEIERRPGRTITLTRETAMFVGLALRGYAGRLDERAALQLQYVVSMSSLYWPHGVVIAGCGRPTMAWAAFQAAVSEYPEAQSIILHQGPRVMGRHPPGATDRIEAPAVADRLSDPADVQRYVARARQLYFVDESGVEIADPPVVERVGDDGRILAWLPVRAWDLDRE